jgi:hypothetical protein
MQQQQQQQQQQSKMYTRDALQALAGKKSKNNKVKSKSLRIKSVEEKNS